MFRDLVSQSKVRNVITPRLDVKWNLVTLGKCGYNFAMHVPIRELKARLSEFLRLAAEGEEVIVTLHKRPIAKIVAMGRAPESERDAIQRLNALPWVRPGADGVPQGSRTPARIVAGGTPVSALAGESVRPRR